MILHGAARIMRMKEDRVKVTSGDATEGAGDNQQNEPDIDIDQLI